MVNRAKIAMDDGPRVLTNDRGRRSRRSTGPSERLRTRSASSGRKYLNDSQDGRNNNCCSFEHDGLIPKHEVDEIPMILSHLQHESGAVKRDGLLALQTFLNNTTKVLKTNETRILRDIFNRYLSEVNSKLYSQFLDVLSEFIGQYKNQLQDWLYILLTRLLHRISSEALPSAQTKVAVVLDIVRDAYPYEHQFQIIIKYITDNTASPSIKMKARLLQYFTGLIPLLDANDLDNSPLTRMAVSRIVTWIGEPKSPEVRKESSAVIIALFQLNSAQFTMLVSGMPAPVQEAAMRVIQVRLKNKMANDNMSEQTPNEQSNETSRRNNFLPPKSPARRPWDNQRYRKPPLVPEYENSSTLQPASRGSSSGLNSDNPNYRQPPAPGTYDSSTLDHRLGGDDSLCMNSGYRKPPPPPYGRHIVDTADKKSVASLIQQYDDDLSIDGTADNHFLSPNSVKQQQPQHQQQEQEEERQQQLQQQQPHPQQQQLHQRLYQQEKYQQQQQNKEPEQENQYQQQNVEDDVRDLDESSRLTYAPIAYRFIHPPLNLSPDVSPSQVNVAPTQKNTSTNAQPVNAIPTQGNISSPQINIVHPNGSDLSEPPPLPPRLPYNSSNSSIDYSRHYEKSPGADTNRLPMCRNVHSANRSAFEIVTSTSHNFQRTGSIGAGIPSSKMNRPSAPINGKPSNGIVPAFSVSRPISTRPPLKITGSSQPVKRSVSPVSMTSPPVNRVGDGAEHPDDVECEQNKKQPMNLFNQISTLLANQKDSNDSEDVKDALQELNKLLKSWDKQVVAPKLKETIPDITALLRHNEATIRCLATRSLREIARSHVDAYRNNINSFLVPLLQTQTDVQHEVARLAEECCTIVSQTLSADELLPAVSSLVGDLAYPVNLAAIKMLGAICEKNCDKNTLMKHIEVIVTNLLKSYDHNESSARKAAVFCLVSLHNLAGADAVTPYFNDLEGSKSKLLNLYIRRSLSTNV